VATDPSPNHNRACDLHEPQTGTWLISSPEYEDWVSGSTRFLWLHGIPGSGKTVLASFVVENVKQFCKTSALHDTALAYYYFYFRRERDEASHLLRWVIAQLCRQSKCIPNQVRELYDAGVEPTTASLVTALSIVVRCFNRVYLVLDALDESSNRPSLLDVLLQVAGDANFKKIRLLALSRKETDIERVLEHISTDISLQNPRVDEDIRLYIQNQLCEDRKFSHWPKSLRAEIETALVKGAKGMYVLQL
jgi:Cdc6-like AAA superfamily ATPase